MDKYQAALDFLYSFVDYEASRQPRLSLNCDLQRVHDMLERLGNPHLAAPCVHIAGTKGKGSTAAMIASVLAASGYRTGLYTSPHLIDVRERIRVSGRLISRASLVSCVERLKPEVSLICANAAHTGLLTTFEMLTVLGFLYFARQKVDFQVVEVGLGGRLDATNVVRPEVCAITTLGLDHTDVLGDTLIKIAAEKAGIVKRGVPLVSARQESEAAAVIEEVCRLNDAVLIRAGVDISCSSYHERRGIQQLEIRGRRGTYQAKLPLYGRFQRENAVVAIGVLEILSERGFNITAQSIADGLRRVRWPGRFELIRRHPLVVTDGAHNLQAARELKVATVDFLKDKSCGKRILVIGMSSDKDYSAVARELAELFDAVITTQSRHPRALPADVLAETLANTPVALVTAPNVPAALDEAVMLGGKDAFICATGSLFIAGEALQWAKKPGS
ncbi:MAG: bifunctional folylpolyglutamate synthase/dihydrofolate synthase [Dehalococcoidia bacterium]|nr:bifunctional folylpolyglutamate synthase/dihydrofolate synthase [Dehalococcoidia bacterium]